MTISRGLRHLDWHPMGKRREVIKSNFLKGMALGIMLKKSLLEVIGHYNNSKSVKLRFLDFWFETQYFEHMSFKPWKSAIFALRSLING